jgi:hypothetical protein
MAIKLYEKMKVDIPIQAVALTGNATSKYYDLSGYDRGLFVLNCAVMGDTETAKIEVFGADNAAGTSGALIAGHTATITSPVKGTIGYIHVNSPDADDEVTVNGVTFTKKATKDDAANEFVTVADLAAQITAAGIGLTGTVDNTNYVLITSTVPGETVVTITDAATKLPPSLRAAQAFVEVDETAGSRYVAAKVTVSASGGTVCSVDLIRGDARNMSVHQATGAQYPA